MSVRAHPQTMQPSRPPRTRTAPPAKPDKFPLHGRYRSYMLFGGAAFFFGIMALLVLRAVWALGTGPDAWGDLIADFRHPLYLAFHVVSIPVFVWCGWRFMIKLFPKSQPPVIGPIQRPPLSFFPPLLYGVWIVATVVVLALLWGVLL